MARAFLRALIALALLTTTTQAEASVTVSYHSARRTVAAGSSAVAVAPCPTGSFIVGGGWDTSNSTLFVYMSFGSTAAWLVGAQNTGSSDESLLAWAACASGDISSSNIARAAATLTIPARRSMCADKYALYCGSGVATAGGFWYQDTTYPTDLVYFQSRGFPYTQYQNEWETCFYNPSGVSRQVILLVHCVVGLPAATVYWADGDYAQIASGQWARATASCYNGGYATAGGFLNATYGGNPDDLTGVRIYTSKPSGGASITAAHNRSSAWAWVTPYARCLNVP